jgi:glycerol-3-phosphate O-acyltransferase
MKESEKSRGEEASFGNLGQQD